jgi:site-specific DNA recombinase
MSKTNGRPIRFAALIRVSTEKQEKKGESLRTQRKQIDSAIKSLGGIFAASYGGQEHATAGWERQQLDEMLADAVKKPKPFDAVIVADATRWSRDNVASQTGLETLRDAGIHFYVLQTKHDLFNPESRLFLALTATIGAYHAHTQKLKSLQNKIERAKRGIPTGGALPIGRTFDKATGKWGVVPHKKAMIEDVAERYLAGETLPKLAREYSVDHSNLCKILRERCGGRWTETFRSESLNINETVTHIVPRLLPEKLIRAVRLRLEANRTYLHGRPKHHYLLNGYIFCEKCGYSLTGQCVQGTHLYYRHATHDRAKKCVARPWPFVRADRIEQDVVFELHKMLGNPAAIERAVKAAVPDCDKLLERRKRLEAELANIDRTRNAVLDRIERKLLTDSQADKKLLELKERGVSLQVEFDKIGEVLAEMPDSESARLWLFKDNGLIALLDEEGNEYAGGNDIQSYLCMMESGQDLSALIKSALSAPLPDGKPAGVYVSPAGDLGPKRFRYHLLGRLIGRVTRRVPS